MKTNYIHIYRWIWSVGKFTALVLILLLVLTSTFFTIPPKVFAATSPSLGTAATYSILAGSSVTNTGATTISGDVGISPGAGGTPNYTGFGTVTLGGTINDANGAALTAMGDRTIAYTALASQGCDTDYGAVTTELAGKILVPGVYCSTSFHLSSGTLTLNGAASDVWIFKSASDLIITGGASAKVVFTGSGQPCNVWWRVVSTATFDANSMIVGNILADTSITFAAGASLDGRALSRTAEVTLSSNTIIGSTCAVAPSPSPSPSPSLSPTPSQSPSPSPSPSSSVSPSPSPSPSSSSSSSPSPSPSPTPSPSPDVTPGPSSNSSEGSSSPSSSGNSGGQVLGVSTAPTTLANTGSSPYALLMGFAMISIGLWYAKRSFRTIAS